MTNKALPLGADFTSRDELLSQQLKVSDLPTPLLVLDEQALAHNISWMATWVADRGLELMPHGKTTMAPALWHRQLEAGATGIAVANPFQLSVARQHGVYHVMVANQVVDPAALRWMAEDLSSHRGSLLFWVDSEAGVDIAESALSGTGLTMEVLVELGHPGARSGVRSTHEAVLLGKRVAASESLRLAGVAGYEGAVSKGRSAAALQKARQYVQNLMDVFSALNPWMEAERPIVTAGGSAMPDVVAEVFTHHAAHWPQARFVLRSGAYIVHDEGIYQRVSPFEGTGLRAAARGLSRVLSTPEPGLALTDAGRRDFPYDEGYPRPVAVLGRDGAMQPVTAEVTGMNDQHLFVRSALDGQLRVGDVLVLGLSHPCTMFDKWTSVPVLSSIYHADQACLVDIIDTYF